jgi:RNA recognition motif-containing protein
MLNLARQTLIRTNRIALANYRNYASKSLYMGNLSWSVTREDLTDLVAPYSQPEDIFIPLDPLGRAKGIAFVTLEEEAANKVIDELNSTQFLGRTLKVSMALRQPGDAPARAPRTEEAPKTEESA